MLVLCVLAYISCILRFSFKISNLGIQLSKEDDKEYEIPSPNGYPIPYPNNAFKFWDIRAPTGYVIAVDIDSFEIERGQDYLHIGDGVHNFRKNTTGRGEWIQLTGRKSDADVWQYNNIISNTSSMKFIFTSDGSHSDVGFILKCSVVRILRGHTTATHGRKYFWYLLVFV